MKENSWEFGVLRAVGLSSKQVTFVLIFIAVTYYYCSCYLFMLFLNFFLMILFDKIGGASVYVRIFVPHSLLYFPWFVFPFLF